MVRSILLRGFDQQIAEKIGDFMELEGVKFIRPCVPTKVQSVSCCTKFHKIYLKSKETKVNSHDICKQVVRGFCTNYLNGFRLFFPQIEKLEDGQPSKYRVTGKYDDGMEFTDEFNTVRTYQVLLHVQAQP